MWAPMMLMMLARRRSDMGPDDAHDACPSAPMWAPMMLMMLARRRSDMGPDDAHDACPSAPMWAPMMLMMLARRRSDMGPDDAHDACPSAPMWAPMMLMMLARRRSDMGPDDAHDACPSAPMWAPMMLMMLARRRSDMGPDDAHDACPSAPMWAPMMLMMLARRRSDMGPDDAHDACPSAPMWAPMMLMMLARRRSDMGPDDAHDACPSAPMWAPMMLMMLARRRSDMGPDDAHDACPSAPMWAPMMLMMLARRRSDMGPDDAHDACPSAPMWAPMMLMMLARRRSDMGPDDAHDACPSAPMWAPMMLMMLARRRSDMGPDDAHDACPSAPMWAPMMLMMLARRRSDMGPDDAHVNIRKQGWLHFFSSEDHVWNWLDMIIVVLGTLDQWVIKIFFIAVYGRDQSHELGSSLMLFRLLRMLRILRVLRLVKVPRDSMYPCVAACSQQDLRSGKVLLYAIWLTRSAIVITRIVRETHIEDVPDAAKANFQNVPDSMFTLFVLMNGEVVSDNMIYAREAQSQKDDALQGERRAKVQKALNDVFFASRGLSTDKRLAARDWQDVLKDLLDMFDWLEADESDSKVSFQEVLRGVMTLAEPPSGKTLLQVDSEVKQRFSRLQQQGMNAEDTIAELDDKAIAVREIYSSCDRRLNGTCYSAAMSASCYDVIVCWDTHEDIGTSSVEGIVAPEPMDDPQDSAVAKEEGSEEDEDSEEEYDRREGLWPLEKLKARLEAVARGVALGGSTSASRKLAVLLTTGAMNPPHLGHTELVQKAAERLRRAGFEVAGAWISPSHDGYVQPKARKLGTIGLSSPFRLEAARRAVRSDDLLDVASWEAQKPGRWPDFPEVAVALQRKLESTEKAWKLDQSFKVFYACGTDHAKSNGLYKGLLPERGLGVVVVPRAGDAAEAEVPEKSVYVAEGILGEGSSFSSTMLRTAFKSRRATPVVEKTVADEAASFLLRPTREEFLMFPEDFGKLGIEIPPAPAAGAGLQFFTPGAAQPQARAREFSFIRSNSGPTNLTGAWHGRSPTGAGASSRHRVLSFAHFAAQRSVCLCKGQAVRAPVGGQMGEMSGQMGPGQMGPGPMGPGPMGPGAMGPGQLGPGQMAPGQMAGQIGGQIGGQMAPGNFPQPGSQQLQRVPPAVNNYDDDIENEPPLLEELGINVEHILLRMQGVAFFKKLDEEILKDADLSGPLLICLTLGMALLLVGKLQFGYVYGLIAGGSFGICCLINVMSQKEGIDLYRTISILGYGLIPIVFLALFGILVSLKSTFGSIMAAVCIAWATASSSRFFAIAIHMQDQRWLVAYPVGLVYTFFTLITIF
ncbi:Protein YIPF5 [Symbiodinium microadriaticum]|uniref:Protein YIPF5 n=1 Tax=Symbiodinium microadriaticum TaxID=2951 RepID=A0A1Q9CB57_SYMMI|nr:Protein YIPF5 [Symbiodinium microadriaticum]